MIYFIQCEIRVNGRLIDKFTHSFAYETEEKANARLAEYIERDIKDGFKKTDKDTVIHDSITGQTEYKYNVVSLVLDRF